MTYQPSPHEKNTQAHSSVGKPQVCAKWSVIFYFLILSLFRPLLVNTFHSPTSPALIAHLNC